MKERKSIFVWFGISFLLIVILFSIIRDKYRDNKFENSVKSKAVLVKYSTGTAKHGKRGYFEYKISDHKFEFIQDGDFSNLKLGDTVEIEYSLEDKNVVRVINYENE